MNKDNIQHNSQKLSIQFISDLQNMIESSASFRRYIMKWCKLKNREEKVWLKKQLLLLEKEIQGRC